MFKLILLFTIWTLSSVVAAEELKPDPSRDETIEALNAIWKLCGRHDVEGDGILVRYAEIEDTDPMITFKKVINTNGVANFKTQSQRIDLSDTERMPSVSTHEDGQDYVITFQCKTTACAQGGKTELKVRMCGNDTSGPRSKYLVRMMNGLLHLWDITDKKKLAF